MTKYEAFYQFYSQFGLPAYEENSVPSGDDFPGYPYLVYEVQLNSFSDTDTALSFSIIDRTDSLIDSYEKSGEIAAYISRGGKVIAIDGGYMRIYRGSPWAQVQRDPNDEKVKRLYHTVNVAFYTNN